MTCRKKVMATNTKDESANATICGLSHSVSTLQIRTVGCHKAGAATLANGGKDSIAMIGMSVNNGLFTYDYILQIARAVLAKNSAIKLVFVLYDGPAAMYTAKGVSKNAVKAVPKDSKARYGVIARVIETLVNGVPNEPSIPAERLGVCMLGDGRLYKGIQPALPEGCSVTKDVLSLPAYRQVEDQVLREFMMDPQFRSIMAGAIGFGFGNSRVNPAKLTADQVLNLTRYPLTEFAAMIAFPEIFGVQDITDLYPMPWPVWEHITRVLDGNTGYLPIGPSEAIRDTAQQFNGYVGDSDPYAGLIASSKNPAKAGQIRDICLGVYQTLRSDYMEEVDHRARSTFRVEMTEDRSPDQYLRDRLEEAFASTETSPQQGGRPGANGAKKGIHT